MKICNKCNKKCLLSNFHKSSITKDGLQHSCKECQKSQSRKSYQKYHKRKKPLSRKEWNKLPHVKEYNRNYNKKQRQDPVKGILVRLRSKIGNAILENAKKVNNKKGKKTLDVLGLKTWDDFRKYIESLWTEGMSWDNHGVGANNTTWHIDHIMPLSSAKTLEDVYKLNHYTNLRPMWGSDNIRKSNKIQ